ncbi:MAG: Dabb family protein [Acidimicrobiia bacterium]
MITHVVMFRWRPEMPSGQQERIVAALSSLPDAIDSIRSYALGPDVGASGAANFDFAISATFDDIDGWRAYDTHPEHDRVRADVIRPWIAERASVQFES